MSPRSHRCRAARTGGGPHVGIRRDPPDPGAPPYRSDPAAPRPAPARSQHRSTSAVTVTARRRRRPSSVRCLLDPANGPLRARSGSPTRELVGQGLQEARFTRL
jgi:hypothetical protein